jgi:hypothetical protein
VLIGPRFKVKKTNSNLDIDRIEREREFITININANMGQITAKNQRVFNLPYNVDIDMRPFDGGTKLPCMFQQTSSQQCPSLSPAFPNNPPIPPTSAQRVIHNDGGHRRSNGRTRSP